MLRIFQQSSTYHFTNTSVRHIYFRGRGILLHLVTTLWAGQLGEWQLDARQGQNLQTFPGLHPVSFWMGIGHSFHRDKAVQS
jgi:hypothetical protein